MISAFQVPGGIELIALAKPAECQLELVDSSSERCGAEWVREV